MHIRHDGPGLHGASLERPEQVPHATLLALVRDAVGRIARVPSPGAADELAVLGAVLERTHGRIDAGTRAHVLRLTLTAQLAFAGTARTRADGGVEEPVAVAPVLDELLGLVTAHGLSLFGADAQALVARRALLADDEEGALAAITTAVAYLDEPVVVDYAPTEREHHRNVQDSHRLVVGTLASLGMHESAVPLLDRASDLAAEHGDHLGTARCAYERVRVEASWGLRLQRAGRDGSAHLRRAADTARALVREAVLLPSDHQGLLRAAVVLDRSGPDAPDRSTAAAERHVAIQDAAALARLGEVRPTLHDHLLVELAHARARARAGSREQASTALARVRASRPRGERNLLLSVFRELTHLRGGRSGDGALAGYVAELEAELWSLHQARALSLSTRVAHEHLRREHGEIAAQAVTDPLTGLPNRRALDDFLARHLAGDAAPVAVSVAMVDVDGFKGINDHLSHARGDEVLRLVGDTLRHTLRSADLVARYGGDEFVVVLPGSTAGDADAALARAVRAVGGVAVGDGTTVSLSVGVASCHGNGAQPADLLARADAAMYEAKRAGGRGVHVDPGAPAATAGTVPLDGAPLDGAPFEGAPLDGAPLEGAPLDGAPLEGAPLGAARRVPAPHEETRP